MNTADMTTQEKSVMLIGLMPDWKISPHWSGDMYLKIGDDYEIALHDPHFLYAPRVMWVAWRVLNWAIEYRYTLHLAESGFFDDWQEIIELPPAEAQAAWLDKILELAIEAGLITP